MDAQKINEGGYETWARQILAREELPSARSKWTWHEEAAKTGQVVVLSGV